jgi:hypothetical protein
MAEDWKPRSNVLRISGVSIATPKPGRNARLTCEVAFERHPAGRIAGELFTHKLHELYAMVTRNHLCGFFTDHDRRRVGVAANYVGHDTSISDA